MQKVLLLVLCLLSVSAFALELPEMSFSNQTGFLKKFPLDQATPSDLLNAYGPPKSKMDGLPDNSETWTYYPYTADGVSYTFFIKNGLVYEITNKYQGFTGPTERKARKIQGLKN